ncbi:MAG: glycosyltransferase family 39 protein [Bifidobacteriaceae bacterium]|jgi:hypothetical protein|nr:glycosyltransferase family 39 protein [Bifidobacteriaceae bacterium]
MSPTRPAETKLGWLTRWLVAAGSFAVLAAIAAVAVLRGSRADFGLWWLGAGAACLAAAGLWRIAGRRALAVWRSWRLPKWVAPAAIFLMFFAVKAVFALRWKTQQRSDFLTMYQAAEAILRGDHSFTELAYWHFFAYQTPFAIYEAVMLKLFGGSIIPLLIVGALAMAGTNFLVYLFARRLTGSAVAGLFAGCLYLAYPGPYLEANVLTNDHLSAFLLILGAYLVLCGVGRITSRTTRGGSPAAGSASGGSGRGLRKGRWAGWALVVLGGLVLELGNLARPAGIVVCVALAATSVVWPVMRRHAGQSWRPLGLSVAAALAALAVYALVGVGANLVVKASGINPEGSANNLPEWKFVLGLQPPEGSDYGSIGAYAPTPNPEARKIARELLKQSLRRLPDSWPHVVDRQSSLLWARQDTSTFQFWPQYGPSYKTVADYYAIPDKHLFTVAHYSVLLERGVFLPAVLLAAAGVFALNRDRRWSRLAVFLALFVSAYALVHLAIEVQPRYRYLAMPAIFALTGPAWSWLTGERRRLGQGPPKKRRAATLAPPSA